MTILHLRRIQPPSLFSLLELQLECFMELERQKGKIYRFIDNSASSLDFFDANIEIYNHRNRCVACYFRIVLIEDKERVKTLALASILKQLNLINESGLKDIEKEVDNLFPQFNL